MASGREDLVCQLRELPGCANLTVADLGELRWHTKQRVLLGLLAELPEGKEAVLACAQLQMERNRVRQLDKAAKALPEASRRAEDQLRRAFFSEVGAVLTSLGAAPALRAPKKLHGDTGVCLRAIGFLAARVSGRQRRQSSAPVAAAAAAAAAATATAAASFDPTQSNKDQGLIGDATGSSSKNVGISSHNTTGVGETSGDKKDDDDDDNDNNNTVRGHSSAHPLSGAAHLDDNTGASSHSLERDLSLDVAGKPSPSPLRTAGVRTAQTPRPSRRRRLPGDSIGGRDGGHIGSGGPGAVGVVDGSAASATAEHTIAAAAAAARDGSSPLPPERTVRAATSAARGEQA
ncbi:unnamed protein product, partial [Scytosiphon promiscuus]